jgi:tRNA dimethylallyltransferase
MVPAQLTPRVAVLCGPTGSGKTRSVVAWRAAGLPVEAINVDALQVYRGFDAATAKPDAAERAAVPTWLLDVAEPTEAWNAARHAALADHAIAEVTARGGWPVLVGGTGLYIRAILRGLADIPPVPPAVRDALAVEWQTRGANAMHAELQWRDPAYAARTPPQNRQRVLRALEVQRATGRTFSDFHRAHAAAPDRYRALTVLLSPPPDALHARIDRRAAQMAPLLLAEVRDWLARGLPPTAPALQALGYRQVATWLAGAEPEVDPTRVAVELAHGHRQYAKRQLTWFRAQHPNLQVADASAAETVERVRSWFAEPWG